MTDARNNQNKKKSIASNPFYIVCMAVGIVTMTYLADWGDTPLATGLECAAGALLGISVFYVGKFFLKEIHRMKKKNIVLVTLLVATLIAVSAIVVYAVQAERNTEKQVDAIIEEIGESKNIDKELEAKLKSIAVEALANVDFNSLSFEEDFDFININFEKSFAALDAVGLKPEWVNRPYSLSGLTDKKILVAVEIERAARVEPYGLTAESIFDQTKKQLQGYGIKVISQKELQAIPDYQRLVLMLYINISAQLIEGIDIVPIYTSVEFLETVQLARSPEKFCIATTWKEGAIQMGEKKMLPHVTTTVRDIVQEFINDYLAANPKEQPTKGEVKNRDILDQVEESTKP